MRYVYRNNCVNTPKKDVPSLSAMIDDAREIARATFLKHVDRAQLADLEVELGYARHPAQGLTMAGDHHVRYYRSKWEGRRCYYFCWSAIEYYFLRP